MSIQTQHAGEVRRSATRPITLTQSLVFGGLLGFTITVGYFWSEGRMRLYHSGFMINNARQLYLATFQMAIDGEVNKDESCAWPGDLRTAKSPAARVTTVSGFINRLMEQDYLKSSDVKKVCAAPGFATWDDTKPFDGDRNCAFKIYTVSKDDGAAAVFCASRNFSYNKRLDPNLEPYRDRGFVVMRKGGDGAAVQSRHLHLLKVVGLLPGRRDYEDSPRETPEDTLLQR